MDGRQVNVMKRPSSENGTSRSRGSFMVAVAQPWCCKQLRYTQAKRQDRTMRAAVSSCSLAASSTHRCRACAVPAKHRARPASAAAAAACCACSARRPRAGPPPPASPPAHCMATVTCHSRMQGPFVACACFVALGSLPKAPVHVCARQQMGTACAYHNFQVWSFSASKILPVSGSPGAAAASLSVAYSCSSTSVFCVSLRVTSFWN